MCRSRLKPYNSASCITVRSPIIVRAPDSLRKLNQSRVIEASEFFNAIDRKQKFKTLPTFRRREAGSVAPRNRQLGQQWPLGGELEYFFRHYWHNRQNNEN